MPKFYWGVIGGFLMVILFGVIDSMIEPGMDNFILSVAAVTALLTVLRALPLSDGGENEVRPTVQRGV